MPQIKKTVKAKNDQKCILYSCQNLEISILVKLLSTVDLEKLVKAQLQWMYLNYLVYCLWIPKLIFKNRSYPISSIVPIS